MRLACVFLLCLFSKLVFSQKTDSLRAATLVEKAVQYLENEQLDSSLFCQKAAANAFLKMDDLAAWLGVASQLSKAWQNKKSNSDQAIQTLKTAIAKLPRPPKTEKEWDKLAWTHVKIAYLSYYETGNLDQARRHYEAAKKIFEDHLDPDDPDVADYVYRELGNLYTRLGDYEAAEILLEKFKDVSIRHGLASNAADACSDLGRIFSDLEFYDRAVAVCLEGLDLQGLPAASRAILQANLTEIYLRKGDFNKALRLGEQARQTISEVILSDEHPRAKAWQSHLENILGQTNAALHRFPAAETQMLKALEIAAEFYAPDPERREIAKLEAALGNLYLEWKKPRLALAYFHRSLRSVMPDFQDTSTLALPAATSIFAENSIEEGLLGKAIAFEQLYVLEKNPAHLHLALRCRSLAFEAGERLRQTYQFESSKLKIIELSQVQSERAISLSLDLHRQTGNPALRDSAFLFAEINKSVLLSEALRHNDAKSIANVPDSLLRKTGSLEAEIAELEKEVFKAKKLAGATSEVQKLEVEILKKRNAHKDLLDEIGQAFPAFYRQGYEKNIATLAETQRLLRPDQALIEYFVGDSNLFIFLLKKDAFTVERLPKNFPLEQWVSEFRQGIEAFQFSSSNRDSLCLAYTDLGQKLYQKLLKPLEKQGLPKNLIIVPSGVLGFLPFDALLTEAPAEPCRFKSYPYLVRRYAISYNYSSTLFMELSEGRKRKASAGFAAFAPQFSEGNASGFGALQFNIASAEAIREMVGGKIYPGAAATGQAFLSNAEKFRLLYLATHAKANTDEGDFSFIILAGSTPLEGGRGVSGFDTIFVKDIYNLPLAADLVFLGACETGSGKMHNGEGIISLARSFLYAGARSIVTTLWSINDESNKNLTISFFRHLSGGERKDVALQLAKLEQLENSPHDLYAHPVFWAAYTPIGNMEAVENGFPWWMAVAGIGVVGLAFFAMRRRFVFSERGGFGKKNFEKIFLSKSASL